MPTGGRGEPTPAGMAAASLLAAGGNDIYSGTRDAASASSLYECCFVSVSTNDNGDAHEHGDQVRGEVLNKIGQPCCVSQHLELHYEDGSDAVIDFNSHTTSDAALALEPCIRIRLQGPQSQEVHCSGSDGHDLQIETGSPERTP